MTREGAKEVTGFILFLFITLVVTGWLADDVDERCVIKHDSQNRPVTICE